MALDPTLACYFATRAFEYRRLERMKAGRRQIADNRSHMATARAEGLRPKGTTFEKLAADNDRDEQAIDRLFRIYDWTCAVLDECHVLSFPNISIEAFDDAWNATASIPGVPEIFDRLPFPVCFIGLGEGVLMDYEVKRDGETIGMIFDDARLRPGDLDRWRFSPAGGPWDDYLTHTAHTKAEMLAGLRTMAGVK